MPHPAYSHEAGHIAARLFDEATDRWDRRELKPHEEEFLSVVHEARKIADPASCEAALTAALDAYRNFDPDELTFHIEEAA